VKICFLPSDFDGPGSYRCLFIGAELEKRGHEVVLPPYTQDETGKVSFGARLPKAELYVIQRRLEAWLPSRVIPALKGEGHAVIVEADDDDFNLPSWHKAFEILTPQRKAVLIALARTADACTVSTPSLLARYRQFNPHTHLLTNYLDWEMWKDVTPVYERRDWKRLRVGWFGSFEMREGDLREISGWLRPWLEQHPEVDFAIGGPGTQEAFDFLRVPEAQRVVLPTYPFATGRLPEMLQFDIGLVPLQEIAFNRAKSHLKGMEYGAAGIPFVASPSQSYQDWVARGGGGLLAQRDRDWKRHLDKLVADDRYRQQLAERGREVASRNTIQEHVGAWEKVYEETLARTRFRKRPVRLAA
jgi:glycosyltransferase involved in cell wall biosynthesis